MGKYFVTLPLGASVSVEVTAESKKEALHRAYRIAEFPCLCYHCAKQLELGEFMDVTNLNDFIYEIFEE